MRAITWAGIAGLCFSMAVVGCGGPQGAADPAAAEQQVVDSTKTSVNDFVTKAKAGKAGKAELELLLESVAAQADQHGGAYVTVRDEALALKTMYEQNKPKAEINAQLEKLDAAANSLGAGAEA